MLKSYGRDEAAAIRLTRGRGCSSCYDSGYRGRVPIHEVVTIDQELQRLVMRNAPRDEYQVHLRDKGVRSLRDDGTQRAVEGITTLDEIARAISG